MKMVPINDEGFTNIAFQDDQGPGGGGGARVGQEEDDPEYHRSVSQTSFNLEDSLGEAERADRYRVRPKSARPRKPPRSMTYRVWKCVGLVAMAIVIFTVAIMLMLRFRLNGSPIPPPDASTLPQQIFNQTEATTSALNFQLNSTTTQTTTYTSEIPGS